jgi:nucleotide-binding universal stress UspA family protein
MTTSASTTGNTESPRIVVGIDYSDACVDALRWAVGEAKRRHARLDIVGVWDVEPLNLGVETAILTAPHGQPADRLARVDQVIEWVQPGRERVDYSTELLSGNAGTALTARSDGAELIVLGSPRHIGLPFAAPTVVHILKHAACPVVLVPSLAHAISETAARS